MSGFLFNHFIFLWRMLLLDDPIILYAHSIRTNSACRVN